jgi:alkylhydroperoxidase family enzyme
VNITWNIQRLFDAVLLTSGETDSRFRRTIEEQLAEMSMRVGEMMKEIAPDLAYVNKVVLHAYKVTDEDIEALRQVGYSEDAIFEITLSAAIGAGRVRLERGLAAYC